MAVNRDKKEECSFKVFDYVEELDCFLVNQEYDQVARYLGLAEWGTVIWIGRFFHLDNDVGEHWFDNWEEREALSSRAHALGYEEDDLMIIRPSNFLLGKGVHTEALRKQFWTDVLKSLRISLNLMVEEARFLKAEIDQIYEGQPEEDKPEGYVKEVEVEVEERILEVKNKYTKAGS